MAEDKTTAVRSLQQEVDQLKEDRERERELAARRTREDEEELQRYMNVDFSFLRGILPSEVDANLQDEDRKLLEKYPVTEDELTPAEDEQKKPAEMRKKGRGKQKKPKGKTDGESDDKMEIESEK